MRTWNELSGLVPHIFLPRKLPASVDDDIHILESTMLLLMNENLEAFALDIQVEDSSLDKTLQLFRTWTSMQGMGKQLDSMKIKEAICSLGNGDSIALYIRAQNAGLTISIPDSNSVNTKACCKAIISVFPASLKSEVVLGSSSNNIACEYPAISLQVPRSGLLHTEIFGEKLRDLTAHQCDIAMSKSRKSGKDNVEEREVADPLLISKWLTATLSDADSKDVSVKVFPQIQKKIRDDVVWKDARLPFRRSGMFMTIKVVLHLSLVKKFGEVRGAFFFKSVMIKFMLNFCISDGLSDMDLGIQILSKIARRLFKLNKFVGQHKLELASYLYQYEKLRRNYAAILQTSRSSLDKIWGRLIQQELELSRITLSNSLNFKSDTNHLLNHSRQYFTEDGRTSLVVQCTPGAQCPPRHRIEGRFPNLSYLNATDEVIRGIALYDIEYWAQEEFSRITYSEDYAINVRKLFTEYYNTGKCYYEGDPVGYSRLIITCVKIVQVFGNMVDMNHPLLKQHRSGVSLECFPNLLLPTRQSLQLAQSLEKYFENRDRSRQCQHPSLIEEDHVSENTYAVRFAKSNFGLEMRNLQCEILKFGEEKIREKKEELRLARIRCNELRSQSSYLSCTYSNDRWGNRGHDSWCRKCSLIQEANNCKVNVYEKPLPENTDKQLAVVFELRIPVDIACLRDLLFLLASEVYSESPRNAEDRIYFQYWRNYFQVSNHRVNAGPNLIHLGSTAKSYLVSHYGRIAKHVDTYDSEFIVINAYNTRYGNEQTLLPYFGTIKSVCTFKIDPSSPYGNLQWMVDSTNHSQNEVLARQVDCRQDLALEEFKIFGSIRAGNRLQLRNIYSAIAQGNLSLKTESVFALICQSIWEAGPKGEAEMELCRDSHEDIQDPNFTRAFVKLLSDELKTNSENWAQPLILLVLIVLANRILDLSEDPEAQNVTANFLRESRRIANSWIVKIKELMGKMTQAPISEVNNLREKLIECAASSAFTFSVDPGRIHLIMCDDKDVVDWILAVVLIDENVVLNLAAETEMSTRLKNILRYVRATGLSLQEELHEHFKMKGTSALTTFCRNHWSGASGRSSDKGWCSVETPREQVYISEWTANSVRDQPIIVEVDIILGKFLVNGAPVGKLPETITKHSDFTRVFQMSVFEVHTEAEGVYMTTTETNNNIYKFHLGEEDRLFIEEINKAKSEKFHLFPYHFLGNDIPPLLKTEYSHWWNKKTGIVEFRPKVFSDKNFHNASAVKYCLNLSTNILRDKLSNKVFVDMNRPSFPSIAKAMARLESANFVHLMYNQNDPIGEVTVELPRMALQFEFQQHGRIISKEFPEMEVAQDQKFGTLIGLEHGFLLKSIENDFENDMVLLVPHGEITILGNNGSNQKVSINTNTLSDPPYFQYDVNVKMRELRAGQNHLGWLYLSYLHAITASPLPDPFTGLTGTEASMKILQSGHSWSCEPINREARKILEKISLVSPGRTYYPEHLKCMQTVNWPAGLYSTAADDSFVLLADKLIVDSERLKFLFPDENVPDKFTDSKSNTIRELNRRAYYRNVAYNGYEARVSGNFDESLNSPVKSTESICFKINFEDSKMREVRRLAHLAGQAWTIAKPSSSVSSLLKVLLLSGTANEKIKYQKDFDQKQTTRDWLKIDFQKKWLDIYNFARRIGADPERRSQWKMLLCFLSFIEATSVDHLLILHTIALNSSAFVDPPPFESYTATSENDFDRTKILSLIRGSAVDFSNFFSSVRHRKGVSESDDQFSNRMRDEFCELVAEQVEKLTGVLERKWPIESCGRLTFVSVHHPHIRIDEAIKKINSEISKWFRNYHLKLFLNKLTETVDSLTSDRDKTSGLPREVVKCCEGGQKLKMFLERERLEIRFEEFLNPEPSSLQCVDLDAQEIFKNGRSIIRISSKSPQIQEPLQFPFQGSSSCPVESFYNESIQNSWDIYHQNRLKEDNWDSLSVEVEELDNQLLDYKHRREKLWRQICSVIYRDDLDPEMVGLYAAGLFPRLTPTVILPLLCRDFNNNEHGTSLKDCIGELCVVWTLEQRAIRCIRYKKAGLGMTVALNRELTNTGYENWIPAKRPEWLLLQLEMDIMIRPVQITVAEKMLTPSNNQNSLMQLNMGEGKTAVIIPLLVVAIADSQRLCRVTVLKSLYRTNLQRLIFNLGGLLNRRIYVFPTRRDMKICSSEAQKMLEVHKECLLKGGVVLTRPEYRLSLQMKGYEKARSGAFEDATSLFILQNWLKDNVRDVLDESDEILDVKYQLIYTVGEQQQIGGSELRWTIAQDVFSLLRSHMDELYWKFGENSIDYRPNLNNTDESYPHFRLLSSASYEALCKLIVIDFMDGGNSTHTSFPPVRSSERELLINFLIAHNTTDQEKHIRALQLYESKPVVRDMLLILRGLLGCGILLLVLSKRWRVNYGVNPTGERLMAVPFRAKDVAAEKTEFGHPDVAILFTHLSYYYSGLSNNQIDECFKWLERTQNPDLEYSRWISEIKNPDPSIKQWKCVNLSNFEQKHNILYPALSKNVRTINFWLSNVVFPKESKQFPGKMVCTAWDLCSDDNRHPVTGFSGTNDSALILPLSISQQNLDELQGTNGQVLSYLLLPENNNYKPMRSGATGSDILTSITEQNIRVLLDVGALILELTNEQVAQKWLELLPFDQVEAVVYFDELDRLVVRNRQNKWSIFENSSYRSRLNHCAVYLDDVHTRGTDLKISSGFTACVTLGTGVTKDKLVQGCMRMRMLGQGHKILFLASHEVNNSIRALVGSNTEQINVKDVLQWAMKNNCAVIRDSMLYWVAAGLNFAQKHSAEVVFNGSGRTNEDLLALGDQCTDKEVLDLVHFFGGYRSKVSVPDIASRYLIKVQDELKSKLKNPEDGLNVVDPIFEKIGSQISYQCQKYVPNVQAFAQLLEEEQERELEVEQQEQRQVHRPGPATPSEHKMNPKVKLFMMRGSSRDYSGWSVKLPRALHNTVVAPFLQEDAWGDNILATQDYIRVVQPVNPKDGVGEYVRTPTWIVFASDDETREHRNIKIMLLISPFEANEMIPEFRAGKMKTTLHLFAAKLRPNQDILMTNMELGVPSKTPNEVFWENYNVFYPHLSVFAGGLYFGDKAEEDLFCRLHGYIPRPRSTAEQAAFDEGWTENGFLKPEYRQKLSPEKVDFCKFQTNPDELIRGIIVMRRGTFPALSHVSQVVAESKKAFCPAQLDTEEPSKPIN